MRPDATRHDPRPKPLSARVRDSRARAIEAGARPTPHGILPPDAALALEALHARGYADSLTGCIARALVEAAKRRTKSPTPDRATRR
jgi:hypothetical protein